MSIISTHYCIFSFRLLCVHHTVLHYWNVTFITDHLLHQKPETCMYIFSDVWSKCCAVTVNLKAVQEQFTVARLRFTFCHDNTEKLIVSPWSLRETRSNVLEEVSIETRDSNKTKNRVCICERSLFKEQVDILINSMRAATYDYFHCCLICWLYSALTDYLFGL